jgi:MerC mercury resistance protein
LLIGVLPLLGLGFLAGDGVEKVFPILSVVLATGGFCWGFRHHQQFYTFLFLFAGFSLIFTGRIWVDGTLEFAVRGVRYPAPSLWPPLEPTSLPALSRL